MIANVPEGVHVASAKKYLRLHSGDGEDLSFAACLELKVPLPWLSDYVRTKAAGETGAYVIDADQLWFRPYPPPDMTKPCWGHLGASQRVCAYRGTPGEISKKKYLRYAKEPGDQLDLATPFYFPKNSPVAKGFVEWFRCTHLTCPTEAKSPKDAADYNSCMKKFKSLFTKHGLEECILPENAFCPLAYHSGWHPKTKLFQTVVPANLMNTLTVIRRESYGINAAWCSSRNSDEKLTIFQRCSLAEMQIGSFWDNVLVFSGKASRRVFSGEEPTSCKRFAAGVLQAPSASQVDQREAAEPEASGYEADVESKVKALSILEQRDAAEARAAKAEEQGRAIEARAAQLAQEKVAAEERAAALLQEKVAAEECAAQLAQEKAADVGVQPPEQYPPQCPPPHEPVPASPSSNPFVGIKSVGVQTDWTCSPRESEQSARAWHKADFASSENQCVSQCSTAAKAKPITLLKKSSC